MAATAFILSCAAGSAAEHTNTAAEDTGNVTNTISLPKAVANASADGYHDRRAKISQPSLATKGRQTILAAGRGEGRKLSSTGDREELSIREEQSSLWRTCAAHEGGSGETSSTTYCQIDSSSDTPADVYKQHHSEEANDRTDGTETSRDDRESELGVSGFGKAKGDRVARAVIVDVWEAYEVVAEADPVTSWEVLRQVWSIRSTLCLNLLNVRFN